MSSKSSRISLITDIIKREHVGSQEQLQQLLAQEGVEVAQATLSRDLRGIGAVRAQTSKGEMYYTIPSVKPSAASQMQFPSALTGQKERFGNAVLSVAVSNNIVVLKTRPGYASGLAFDIDMMRSPYILGTVPGADTVIMVLDEKLSKANIVELLLSFIPTSIINASITSSTGTTKK